jgi:hypothetical protein
MGLASLIIFINTLVNYFKEEASKADSNNIFINLYYSCGSFMGFYSLCWIYIFNFVTYNQNNISI